MSLGTSRITRVCLKSCPDYLPRVRRIAACVAESVGMDRDEVEDTALAVNEACANAIRHGSPNGLEDRVLVSLDSSSRGLTAEISDCGGTGPGIQPPDRGGLGVYLMRALTDDVQFLPGKSGLTVKLTKRPAGGDAPRGYRTRRSGGGAKSKP